MKRNGGKVEQKNKPINTMGYMEEVGRWLDVIFTDLADDKMTLAEVKRDIRERILDSYRNGLKAAGQSPAPRGDGRARRFRERPPAA